MLKRYKIQYKKLQKKRIFDKTIIFFQNFLLNSNEFFQKLFFLYFYRTTLIKLKFVKKFKKRFRKPLKRKHLRLYFFCKPNYLVHQKFKNARMGKGKGSPLLWVYKPSLVKPFALLEGMNLRRVNSIMRFFKLHLSKHIYIKNK